MCLCFCMSEYVCVNIYLVMPRFSCTGNKKEKKKTTTTATKNSSAKFNKVELAGCLAGS